jgi:hypothetical protein
MPRADLAIDREIAFDHPFAIESPRRLPPAFVAAQARDLKNGRRPENSRKIAGELQSMKVDEIKPVRSQRRVDATLSTRMGLPGD